MNEWGISARRPQGLGATATTPPITGASVAVGAGIGAVALGAGASMVMGKKALVAGAAVGLAVGGIAGYMYSQKQQSASPTPTPTPTPTPVPSSTTYVLQPGTMTAVTLSLSSSPVALFTLPAGGPTSINLLSNDSTTVQTSGMTPVAPATATAQKMGSVTLTAAWSDAGGVSQTSTIPVTVTA